MIYHSIINCRPGNPELCSVGASQTATENKPIFQNLPKPITSSKIPNNMESDTKAFKENQIVDINSASQAEAIKSTTHPTTTRTTTIPTTITEPTTTTLTTTPRSTTMTAAATTSSTTTVLTAKSKSVTSITLTTQTPTPTPTPTTTQPPKQSNLGTDGSSFPTNLQQESTALGNTDRAGSVDIDGTETIADAVVNGEATTSDPYSVGQSTISPTFSSDDDVETKVIYHIQDIFKKGKRFGHGHNIVLLIKILSESNAVNYSFK